MTSAFCMSTLYRILCKYISRYSVNRFLSCAWCQHNTCCQHDVMASVCSHYTGSDRFLCRHKKISGIVWIGFLTPWMASICMCARCRSLLYIHAGRYRICFCTRTESCEIIQNYTLCSCAAAVEYEIFRGLFQSKGYRENFMNVINVSCWKKNIYLNSLTCANA